MHTPFLWNSAVKKYEIHGPADVILAYKYIHQIEK